jgi:MFS family permease
MRGVFRSPHLLAYLAGNLFSIIGTWGQRVVVFWMAWELTGSTSIIGLLAALDLLPSVLAAPIAGAMADRRPAFRLTRNVQGLSALPPLIMVAVVLFGEVNLAILMLLTLTTGILNGLDHPLRLLLVGSIAPRALVSGAIAANSVVFNIGRMIGPAIGGWAVSAETPAIVFGYNALSFLLFAAVLSRLKPPMERRGSDGEDKALDGSFGWGEVFRAFEFPVIHIFSLFAAIAALIRPIFELLPSFAEDLSRDGFEAEQIFSLLTSSQGLGAMFGALAASNLLARMQYRAFAMAAGVTSMLAALSFLGITQFHIALTSLTIVSGAVLANGIATQIALQTQLPEKVRGRALSLYTMTFRGMPALGALLIGALGELAPLRLVCTIAAILMLGLSAWIFRAAWGRSQVVSRA